MGGVEMAPQSGLIAWVGQYGNVVFFFAQLAYWLIIAVAVIYAVYQLKRLVDFKAGTDGADGADDKDARKPAKAKSTSVKIEEFVE